MKRCRPWTLNAAERHRRQAGLSRAWAAQVLEVCTSTVGGPTVVLANPHARLVIYRHHGLYWLAGHAALHRCGHSVADLVATSRQDVAGMVTMYRELQDALA